ncbi:MAG: hypothetical protein IJU56_00995 [Clostridia bacterium]|nr:hypothetical protein [Clostridia bacterium]
MLRFSCGNLPHDPAAGLRTAFAVRKTFQKAPAEKRFSAGKSRNIKGM